MRPARAQPLGVVPGVKNDGEDRPTLGYGEVGVLVSPRALDQRHEELVRLLNTPLKH